MRKEKNGTLAQKRCIRALRFDARITLTEKQDEVD